MAEPYGMVGTGMTISNKIWKQSTSNLQEWLDYKVSRFASFNKRYIFPHLFSLKSV